MKKSEQLQKEWQEMCAKADELLFQMQNQEKEEEAEKELKWDSFYNYSLDNADFIHTAQAYRNFARHLNGDWVADWSGLGQNKYGMCVNGDKITIGVQQYFNAFLLQVFFKDRESAEKALKAFGEERLRKLIP